jgi:hypothetical protein
MKNRPKYYARRIGIVLLSLGPLFFIFAYIVNLLPLLALFFPDSPLPQEIPSFPLCDTSYLLIILGVVEFAGYLSLFYGLLEKKKSKKSNVIGTFILLTSLLIAASYLSFLGLFAACFRF